MMFPNPWEYDPYNRPEYPKGFSAWYLGVAVVLVGLAVLFLSGCDGREKAIGNAIFEHCVATSGGDPVIREKCVDDSIFVLDQLG